MRGLPPKKVCFLNWVRSTMSGQTDCINCDRFCPSILDRFVLSLFLMSPFPSSQLDPCVRNSGDTGIWIPPSKDVYKLDQFRVVHTSPAHPHSRVVLSSPFLLGTKPRCAWVEVEDSIYYACTQLDSSVDAHDFPNYRFTGDVTLVLHSYYWYYSFRIVIVVMSIEFQLISWVV